MEFFVGVALAAVVVVFARVVGLDRDRAFYPTVLVVVASYYCLFAVMGGSTRALIVETGVAAVFVAATVLGFRRSMWFVAAGLAGHGVFDFFHDPFVANPGVPAWWPMFCLSFDVAAGLYLAWVLVNPAPAQTTEPSRPRPAGPDAGA
jgi:hypothetical protein